MLCLVIFMIVCPTIGYEFFRTELRDNTSISLSWRTAVVHLSWSRQMLGKVIIWIALLKNDRNTGPFMGADCPIKIILKMTYFHDVGRMSWRWEKAWCLEADDTGAPLLLLDIKRWGSRDRAKYGQSEGGASEMLPFSGSAPSPLPYSHPSGRTLTLEV